MAFELFLLFIYLPFLYSLTWGEQNRRFSSTLTADILMCQSLRNICTDPKTLPKYNSDNDTKQQQAKKKNEMRRISIVEHQSFEMRVTVCTTRTPYIQNYGI